VCIPCRHGVARSDVADGGEILLIWKVAGNWPIEQARSCGLETRCTPSDLWLVGG
jgi:hypothetical protein